MTKFNIMGLTFGILFGGVLGASNLHEYDTIHSMLAFEELDVYFFMASAIVVSAPLLWLMERREMGTRLGGKLALSRSKPQPHHIKGGALFGIGWAVAGTCPAPALVMLSSGALLSLVAIPGIFLGLQLRERQQMHSLHVGDGEHRNLAHSAS